ncbi:hypothetical protein IscW_ISCW016191 [Ixodes scapularis]|uniref:Uncharacterized protein n=1 Tax=Ixodes scapularis TaxID=6945 RepID=B7P373_IXOSC|nr:hypothetical protein IscW_ISCW016191 [Ixodes scapularis]|eukprot:XP_002403632.1 hypothetical protein IscW_ISCW016191 [Ixodes scapularis]
MSGLEQFLPQLGSQDNKKRLQLGLTMLSFLEENPDLQLDCEEVGPLVDPLVAWLNSSNSKVRACPFRPLSCSVLWARWQRQ